MVTRLVSVKVRAGYNRMTTFVQAVLSGHTKAGYRPFKSRRQYRSCARKLRYSDFLSAILHVSFLERLNQKRQELKKIEVYPCKYCHGLHIGRTKTFKSELVEDKFQFLRG